MEQIFSYLPDVAPGALIDPDRIYTAMGAVILCAVVGMVTGPLWGNANPLIWKLVEALFGRVGTKLDRPHRRAADLMFRGFMLLIPALLLFFALGHYLQQYGQMHSYKGLTEMLLLTLSMSVGTVWFALLRLYFARRDGKPAKGALAALSVTSRTDLSQSDMFGVTRIAMAQAARSFDKGVVAPVFWYLIAGLPGAYIYACLAAFGWRFGKDGFSSGFAGVPLALEKLLGFVPGAFAGVLIALSGLFTPTGGMTRALRALGPEKGGKGRAAYDQGGWPVTAFAFSLNVSLGGPATDLAGSALPRAWVGPENATAQLENGHLRRALYISLMAHMLFLASLLGAVFWAGVLI
ncbi:MAG TPA: cobalamin biosynthesis protein [Micavibrio sp.]